MALPGSRCPCQIYSVGRVRSQKFPEGGGDPASHLRCERAPVSCDQSEHRSETRCSVQGFISSVFQDLVFQEGGYGHDQFKDGSFQGGSKACVQEAPWEARSIAGVLRRGLPPLEREGQD